MLSVERIWKYTGNKYKKCINRIIHTDFTTCWVIILLCSLKTSASLMGVCVQGVCVYTYIHTCIIHTHKWLLICVILNNNYILREYINFKFIRGTIWKNVNSSKISLHIWMIFFPSDQYLTLKRILKIYFHQKGWDRWPYFPRTTGNHHTKGFTYNLTHLFFRAMWWKYYHHVHFIDEGTELPTSTSLFLIWSGRYKDV